MVAIPQSGLLAQVSSLRLPSGHSSLILTLSNAARTSLPSPRLLVADADICAACLLGVTIGHVICGFKLFIYFSSQLHCPRGSKAHHRLTSESVSWCLEASLFFKTPFLGWISIPISFVFLFIFYIFSYLLSKRDGLLFWVPDVIYQHSEVVLWNLLSVQIFFL